MWLFGLIFVDSISSVLHKNDTSFDCTVNIHRLRWFFVYKCNSQINDKWKRSNKKHKHVFDRNHHWKRKYSEIWKKTVQILSYPNHICYYLKKTNNNNNRITYLHLLPLVKEDRPPISILHRTESILLIPLNLYNLFTK